MIEQLRKKPGARDGDSAPGCSKRAQIMPSGGDRQQKTSLLAIADSEGGLCNWGQKRVETP